MGRRYRMALMPALALIVMIAGACTDEPPPPDRATIAAVPTMSPPAATGTAGPVVPPVAAVAVAPVTRWVAAEAPRLTEAEAADPWAEFTDGPAEWQVYRLEQGKEPELLAHTHRYTPWLEWSADGMALTAHVTTNVAAPPAPNDNPSQERRVSGAIQFSLGRGPVTQTDRVLPRGGRIVPSPRDGRAVLTTERMRCDPGFTAECRVFDPSRAYEHRIYLIGEDGSATRLEGLGDEARFMGWAPDGSGMLVYPSVPPLPARQMLLYIPLGGGKTLPITDVLSNSNGFVWSPDAARLVFVAEGDLYQWSRRTGAVRQLTRSAGYLNHGWLSWSADGSLVIVQGINAVDLVDQATGRVETVLRTARSVQGVALSPDNRRVAIAEGMEPFIEDDPNCPGILAPHRILVLDRAAS